MKKNVLAVLIGLGLLGLMGTQSMAINGEHHLSEAKRHLNEALKEINKAYNGQERFHGDKAKAEASIQSAIQEVEAAKQWADAHPSQPAH